MVWKCVVFGLQLLIVSISNWETGLEGILFTTLKISFLSPNSGTAFVVYQLFVISMPKKQN